MIDLTALNLCYKYFPCFSYNIDQDIKGLLIIDEIEYHLNMYEYGEQYKIDIWYYSDSTDVNEKAKTILTAIGDTPDEALRLAKSNVDKLVIGIAKLAEVNKNVNRL